MEGRWTRRRQPRVRYEANVTIRAQSFPQALRARAHNLSPDGIGVAAEQALQTGEEVECRMLVGGRRARLRGRVAWVRGGTTSEQPFGGIQFHSLEGEDRALLGRLIAGPVNNPQRAEVFIPGLDHPVRMRAIIGKDEVKLGFSVPRLWVGMPVQMSFIQGGNSEHRSGTISAVRFLPGQGDTMARVALQVSTAQAPATVMAAPGKAARGTTPSRALAPVAPAPDPLAAHPARTPPPGRAAVRPADRRAPPPHLPLVAPPSPHPAGAPAHSPAVGSPGHPPPPAPPAHLPVLMQPPLAPLGAPSYPAPLPFAPPGGAGLPAASAFDGPPPPLMAPPPATIEVAPSVAPVRPAFGAWASPPARSRGELPRWATVTLLALGALLGMAVAWLLII